MKSTKPRTVKPGPAPATLAHAGDWELAVKKALAKPRPADGWPKPETKKRAGKNKRQP